MGPDVFGYCPLRSGMRKVDHPSPMPPIPRHRIRTHPRRTTPKPVPGTGGRRTAPVAKEGHQRHWNAWTEDGTLHRRATLHNNRPQHDQRGPCAGICRRSRLVLQPATSTHPGHQPPDDPRPPHHLRGTLDNEDQKPSRPSTSGTRVPSSIPSPHARTLIHPTTGRFMSATGHPDMIISGQLPCPLLGSCKREQRQDPSTTPQPEHPSQPVAKVVPFRKPRSARGGGCLPRRPRDCGCTPDGTSRSPTIYQCAPAWRRHSTAFHETMQDRHSTVKRPTNEATAEGWAPATPRGDLPVRADDA